MYSNLSAAESLEGLLLNEKWKVIDKIIPKKNNTGGNFSVAYLVQSDKQIAFLKAINFNAFFDSSGNVLNAIKEMTDERYMSSMKGKLANLGDDIQDGVIDDKMMKVLKNISTCDFVATRELYESSESISFTNSLIFTSNHMIKSFEKGDSWKRRVMWLPMYSTVSEKNKDNRFISKQTSEEALEYWVSQMVQGYMRLYENNRFTDSHLVESENERYHQENNGMLLFLEDYPVEQLLGKRYMEVYTNNYVPWVEENGGNVQSQKAFKEAVMEVYGLDVQPRKVNGKNQRVFVERKEG